MQKVPADGLTVSFRSVMDVLIIYHVVEREPRGKKPLWSEKGSPVMLVATKLQATGWNLLKFH